MIFQMEILAIMGDSVPALQCSVEDPSKDCTEREIKYIDKVKSWEASKPRKEMKRINAILATPMSDDLRDWARRRVHILSQLVDESNKEL